MEYTHEQLLDFNTYTSDLNWHEVPWIKPIERNIFGSLAFSKRIDLNANDSFDCKTLVNVFKNNFINYVIFGRISTKSGNTVD